MKQPLVSVLMTAYNREAYVGEAIESVLASDYQNFELIVVDDGSKDRTAGIARTYAGRDPRAQVHVNEHNLGDYPNRNKAASYATGEFLKYVDSDDRIYPWGLRAMVNCMSAFPDAGLGLSVADLGDSPHPACLSPRDAYLGHFRDGRGYFGRAPGSAIIRREAFEHCGGFTGRRQVGDHEFWLILCRTFPLVTMPRDLGWDRVHAEQELKKDSDARKAAMHFEIDREQLEHPDCPLTQDERAEAICKIRTSMARIFWKAYALRARIGAGLRYKSEAELSVGELISALRR